MRKAIKKSEMIWKGSTLCIKIGSIIKRMMRCHTVEDVEKEFGNELKDWNSTDLFQIIELLRFTYNANREKYDFQQAAFLTAQASLLTMADTYKTVLDKGWEKDDAWAAALGSNADIEIYINLGVNKRDIKNYIKFLNE